MSIYVLGISSFYHDSAAAILKDGEIIAAAQEERFSRKRHDPRFPVNAINYCLEEAFIEMDEIDVVAFYDNSFLTYKRIVKNLIQERDKATDTFIEGSKSILSTKLWVKEKIKEHFGQCGKEDKVLYCGHHLSHAASAFYPSPFKDAAILTIDGVGEFSTTTISHGKESEIKLLKEIQFPHSLGLLYSAFTYFCGFKVNSGEYKLMGLAPYGKPKYQELIENNLIDIKPDGSFQLNLDYFDYTHSNRMVSEKIENLFGFPIRTPESQIEEKYMDVAASIQKVTENIVIKLAAYAKEITQSENLCLAGGVALNCVANGKVIQQNIFKNTWIQPASGDAGGALGACYIAYNQFLKHPRFYNENPSLDTQKGSLLGPSFSENEIKALLTREKLAYHHFDTTEARNNFISDQLVNEQIVGYFDGRMEFGPRSLGARSIIADTRSTTMQKKLNLKIKYRESFRPFAPIVLKEDCANYFDIEEESPYMLLVAPVKEAIRIQENESLANNSFDMIKQINEVRSSIPAVTHVDYSARVQTVDKDRNPNLYALMNNFKQKSGSSVLVNTSFNVRGEPIVCSPKDALQCFKRTEMDVLVLNNYVLLKSELDLKPEDKEWMNEYELD